MRNETTSLERLNLAKDNRQADELRMLTQLPIGIDYGATPAIQHDVRLHAAMPRQKEFLRNDGEGHSEGSSSPRRALNKHGAVV